MIGSIGMMPLNDRTLRTSHKNAANTPNTADASQLKTVSWSEVVNGTAPTASIVVPRDEEDRAAMNAYFADYFARNPGTHEEQPDLDETMTSGEWKALAEKYDPRSMTRAQYDAFLDDLREMGAINAEDLQILGHSAYQGMVKLTAENAFSCTTLNWEDLPAGGFVPKFEHGASRVDLWAWAQEEKSWKVYDEERNNWVPSHKAEAFEQIYDILQRMRAYG
ncbi:hypothetical protein [Candidatus Allofournierella merdavium]|uniref:hypothetical protein n=1 Tax=Candidatus Allofournierella merdavium TaxID=2838593 RepID=UPI00374ED60A